MNKAQIINLFIALFYLILGGLVLFGVVTPYKEVPQRNDLVFLNGQFNIDDTSTNFQLEKGVALKICESFWINEELKKQLSLSSNRAGNISVLVENSSIENPEAACVKLYEVKVNNKLLLSKADVASSQIYTSMFFKAIALTFLLAGFYYLRKHVKSR